MAEICQDDWTDYAVRTKTRTGWKMCASPCTMPLVRHVLHIQYALPALKSGALAPQLIRDESKLNTERTEVVWLSPNDWVYGYRYGNIAFEFDFNKLIEDKRFYWVGVMSYSPEACRILVTDEERTDLPEYRPDVGEGPWWRDAKHDVHYRNSNYCLEFMFEGSIPLSDSNCLDFVNHHAHQCSLGGCRDRGQDGNTAAARLLAGASHLGALVRCEELWVTKKGKPRVSLQRAWSALKRRICYGVTKWPGYVKATDSQAQSLARYAMGAYCEHDETARKDLVGQFDNADELLGACGRVIERQLDLESGTLK